MVWHDCKTDPPKKDGEYILCYTEYGQKYWSNASYNIKDKEWYDTREYVTYGNPTWGWSTSIPYKWAEVDLSEVE